jgi:hypothetical protein
MGTVTKIWLATAAVAAAAVIVVLLVARGGQPGGPAPAAPVTVKATFDRKAVEFGDPVTAEVTVLVDREAVPDPEVNMDSNLGPLTQLGKTRVTRTKRGNLLMVTYATRAACLEQRCLSSKRSKPITLEPAQVEVRGHGTQTVRWPTLRINGRVAAEDARDTHPPLRADATPPAVSYRVEPGTLATLLDVAAAVLAAAAILLAGWTATALYRSRRRKQQRLTGLARAVVLARQAEQRPPADRRRALGLLASLLGTRDRNLADAADDLAWSAPAPTTDKLSDLVTQVEREVNGR